MEREGIAVLHDADHSLAGIEDDLITIVVVVPRGTVIGGLLPIHVNPPAVRKEPAVSRGVVAGIPRPTLHKRYSAPEYS